MHHRLMRYDNKQHGTALPLMVFFLLTFFLLSGATGWAQDATPAQTAPAPATPDAAQLPSASADTTAQSPSQTQQLPPQTPAQRAKVLRDAQARVRARRQQRVAAIVADTYSHKYEVYFGGGYLRFRPGSTLQHDTQADWNLGVTDYIRPKLGITADFRGYYGTTYTGNNQFSIHNPSISQYTFLAGPQYRLTEGPKVGMSVQGLVGLGHGNFDTGTGGLPGSYLGLYPDSTVFNASVAYLIDYNLGPGLALRLAPGVLFSNYGSELQYNLGFNAGVVYRFGRKK